MSKDNYHRFPDDEKVKDIDYQFYRDMLAGKYDDQINRGEIGTSAETSSTYADALTKA